MKLSVHQCKQNPKKPVIFFTMGSFIEQEKVCQKSNKNNLTFETSRCDEWKLDLNKHTFQRFIFKEPLTSLGCCCCVIPTVLRFVSD